VSYSESLRSRASGLDAELLREEFARHVRRLDEITVAAGHDGTLVEGELRGGDWQGDDSPQAHSFRMTTEEARR
jgi:hypothetical protein